jgi:hypothetical protein
MGVTRCEQAKVKIQGEKHYILVIVSANETGEVRSWFEKLSANSQLEAVFTADIRGRAPLEQPMGLIALLKFDSIPQMKTTITKMATELREHDRWTFDFMKANWIEIDSSLTVMAQNENKRLVVTDGRISFRNRRYYISVQLRGEYVDLSANSENLKVYHNGVLIKTLRLRS